MSADRAEQPTAALVTGAGDRIGRAIAIDLAAAGRAVAVHYHSDAAGAAATVAAIRDAGGHAKAIPADLSDERQAQGLVATAGQAVGPLGLLVNNAAHFAPDDAATATRASWDAHLETNLRAPFVLTQALAAQLPAGATAVAINILDQWVARPTGEFLSYTVAKSGLEALTRLLALSLAPRVRVNAIAPGPVMRGRRESAAHFEALVGQTLLGRATPPGELSAAIAFLAGSPALTGQCLWLDAGYHLASPPPRGRDRVPS